MIVVADAGPLIHLSAIGRLDLLRGIAPQLLVPAAVHEEVVVVGAGLPGADEVAAADWIGAVETSRNDLVEVLLAGGLHRGESEAIALAVEHSADWLLIDERQGRLTARDPGVPVIGTVGVLVAAKTRGDLDAVAPLIESLRHSGLWLSDQLVDRVLRSIGEVESP